MKLKTLFHWHLWLGLCSGIFLLFICVSGSIAVFIEEIDWLVTPALRVNVAAHATRADADTLLARVRATHPNGRVTAINFSTRPRFAHVAKVQSRARGQLDVFLHPVTAEVTGDRVTSAAYSSTLRNFIRQFHVRLLMGLWGRVLVGIFGVTLALSCVTGLWIYRGWFKNLFRLRWRTPGIRTRWSDLHKLVGLWSLLFNLAIAITGAVLGIENLTNQIQRQWLSPRATPDLAKPAIPRPAAAERLAIEDILSRARAAFPDLTVRTVILPARDDDPVVLRGSVPDAFVMQSHVRTANFISLDARTGRILQRLDGREAQGWDRVYSTFDPIHFGYFGGLTSKIIWFVLGLTPVVLSLTGTWLWWRRTRAAHPSPKAKTIPHPGTKPILITSLAITLAGAYVLVARAQGTWALTGALIEHALAKPVSLALVAFPVTGLLAWLAVRAAQHPGRFAAATGLCASWYLVLVTLFQ